MRQSSAASNMLCLRSEDDAPKEASRPSRNVPHCLVTDTTLVSSKSRCKSVSWLRQVSLLSAVARVISSSSACFLQNLDCSVHGAVSATDRQRASSVQVSEAPLAEIKTQFSVALLAILFCEVPESWLSRRWQRTSTFSGRSSWT